MERIIPVVAREAIGNAIEFAYSFETYVRPTVCLVPSVIEAYVLDLSKMIGFDVETLKMTLGMFICYPLGIIMALLPYGKMKHLFSFLLGAFLLQFTIGVQWIHQLITSIVCYLLFLILPAKVSKIVVPVVCMAYVTFGHLHRQYINYLGWDLDFTGPQMVITIKLYSLAYNLFDGEELAMKGKEGNIGRATKKCAPFAVSKLPGIIEFLGYTFCFSNVLAGPAFEYKIYADACDGTLLYKNGDTSKPRGQIPSQAWATLKPFLSSLVFLALFVVGNGMFPLLDVDDPQHNTPVVISPAMLAQPWWYRYGYAWISLFFVRQKYYFAWKNAEGANNIWYAGFEGFDKDTGKVLGWDNANNINTLQFETAPNLRTLSAEWNRKTANWLNRYVYIRTNGSLTATYAMSAFWHGFYPGYYFFFLSVPMLTMCERVGRKKLTPTFKPILGNIVWYFLCWASLSLVVEYMVMSFQLLAFDWGIAYWKSQYFFGHGLCVVFYVVVAFLVPTPKGEKSKEKRK